jgi:hypothetical protein
MVPYHRPKSGHITCYLNRTHHVLLTPAHRRGSALQAFGYIVKRQTASHSSQDALVLRQREC